MLISKNSLKILLIEANKSLSKTLLHFLTSQGYNVIVESDRPIALKKIYSNEFRFLIIDCDLNQKRDVEFIKEVKLYHPFFPILLIGPKNPKLETSAYLIGVNNYHPKPIRFDLLYAQISQLTSFFRKRIILELEDIVIDISTRLFSIHGHQIDLTFNEFSLILFLMKSEGCILSRDIIIKHVFNCNKNISYAAVDTMISRIRKKIQKHSKEPLIDTVYKCGYRINLSHLSRYRIDSL